MRLSTLLLALLFALPTLANYKRGDVNNDGKVSIKDLILLVEILRGNNTSDGKLSNNQTGLADVDANASINLDDARLLVQILAGTYQEMQHAYVDLGLNSGTLWATTNLGATKASEYGLRLAWGEYSTKSNFLTSTYFDSNFTAIPANTDITGTKYDAATVLWGEEWQLPTDAQFRELFDETQCTHSFVVRNGKKGMEFCSLKNGNTLFLPACGYQNGTSVTQVNNFAYYWISNRHTIAEKAYLYYFCNPDVNSIQPGGSYYSRINGRSMRPVRSRN